MHHWSSFASRSMLRARRPMRRGFRSRLMAGFAAAFGVILPLSGLAGCGQIQVTTVSGAPEGPTIAIGVAADEPSVGAWHDGTFQGFDITIAKYVAAKLGYANKQALQLTMDTGTAWFFSRSRQKLWNKGETSGNFIFVKKILSDCDDDTLIYVGTPKGPVCHTGHRTCFFTTLWEKDEK